jgi:hypothetical protein
MRAEKVCGRSRQPSICCTLRMKMRLPTGSRWNLPENHHRYFIAGRQPPGAHPRNRSCPTSGETAAPEPRKHPTSNLERPTPNNGADTGLWMFDVLVLRFRGPRREKSVSGDSPPEQPQVSEFIIHPSSFILPCVWLKYLSNACFTTGAERGRNRLDEETSFVSGGRAFG